MCGKFCPDLKIVVWVFLGLAIMPNLICAQEVKSRFEPQSLEKILSVLKAGETRRIPYQELRVIPAMKAPMEFKGVLEFLPPETLIKSVELPFQSTYVLSNTELRITDGATGETHSLKPESIPELDYIGSSLLSLLNGDKASLLSRWRVTLGGTSRHWSLNLVPIDRELSGLRLVAFDGEGNQLKKIHVEALDGSSSHYTLSTP